MADITITKSHNLEMSDARARLDKMAAELQSKYGIKSSWSGNTATLSGTGLKKGTVELKDSTIKVEITLGMLARAMKGKIEEQVNIAFDKALS
ncbi:MAG: polyhydroxyalkanoic acid system family protein [Deltaproteobacteria bacterium]|nr:polyhydroxyalkanoic acid system family protein [Deltaproteobacteria bacterium]MBN2671209.1 polyhydroxyalkanoic acid system family protein [Deltaproteobacteria bacterium]